MATASAVVDNNIGSDAEFRLYCQAFEDALLASGFLAVASDTGQVDLATITVPGAINTDAGYKIYEAIDDLAATNPLKVRVNYGVGNAVTRPRIGLLFSPTGSNGAGTLSAPVNSSVVYAVNPTAEGSGSSRIFGSGHEQSHAWVAVHDAGSTNHYGFMVVGRLISAEDAIPPGDCGDSPESAFDRDHGHDLNGHRRSLCHRSSGEPGQYR